MRIGFFVQGEDHLQYARLLLASAHRAMPGTEVLQLTNGSCPEITRAIRIPGEMPMGVRRLKHYANLEGDWLFLDTDILIKKDVGHVFDKPFDIALASRDGTAWAGTEYAKVMPYNFGVVFSRNREFWKQALAALQCAPKQLQEWEGEQRITCEMATHKRSPFGVEILSSDYNYTPKIREENLEGRFILHLKGPRKAWMSDLAS